MNQNLKVDSKHVGKDYRAHDTAEENMPLSTGQKMMNACLDEALV
jgi:hypothetical protein